MCVHTGKPISTITNTTPDPHTDSRPTHYHIQIHRGASKGAPLYSPLGGALTEGSSSEEAAASAEEASEEAATAALMQHDETLEEAWNGDEEALQHGEKALDDEE